MVSKQNVIVVGETKSFVSFKITKSVIILFVNAFWTRWSASWARDIMVCVCMFRRCRSDSSNDELVVVEGEGERERKREREAS